MMTSRIEGYRFGGDVLMQKWKEANLLYPSLVRLGKLATIEARLVKKKLGNVQASDRDEIKNHFTKLFDEWLG